LKPVTFDKRNRIIEIRHGMGGPYYIPAGDTLTPAEVADWIKHIEAKTWGPPILGDLKAMFNTLMPDRVRINQKSPECSA